MCPRRPRSIHIGRCCKAHTFLVGTTSCQHCDKTLTADVGWLAGHATVCGQSVGLLTDVCTGGNPSLNQSLSSPSSPACAGCEGCGETQAKKISSCDPVMIQGWGKGPGGHRRCVGPQGLWVRPWYGGLLLLLLTLLPCKPQASPARCPPPLPALLRF